MGVDGRVTGADAEPFFAEDGFSFRRVTFANGKVLRSDLVIDLLPDEVGLRETDIADENGMWFFVGNRYQWLQFMERSPTLGGVESQERGPMAVAPNLSQRVNP